MRIHCGPAASSADESKTELTAYSGYNWTIILPAELSAAAVLINFWNQSVNNAVWITICLVVVITINMFGAGVYGECEFIFAYVIPAPSQHLRPPNRVDAGPSKSSLSPV